MKYFKTCTLGCKVNTYETQAVVEELLKLGYKESTNDQCDLFLINTCAVTSIGENKSRKMIRSAIKNYPDAVIFVMGCSSQIHPDLITCIEGTDIIIGTSGRGRVKELLEEYEESKAQVVEIDSKNRKWCYEDINITDYEENTRAFIKIQDGCNNFCSYCIIPYTRGNSRSRDKEQILKEINALVDKDFKEIVITGIDLGSFGEDKDDNYYLVDLLKDIIKENPELKRIRISSLEESQISDELIELIKNNKVIAPHFHLPLQSGSESVLKRMNRKYTKAEFKASIDKIRKVLPDSALACDVIVGFPGETEEEFLESMEFIKECGFNFLHVFPYSVREGTVASKLKNQISQEVKKERVHRLIELGKELELEYKKKFLGKNVDVLVERYDPKTHLAIGKSGNYLDVEFISEKDVKNEYLEVEYQKII